MFGVYIERLFERSRVGPRFHRLSCTPRRGFRLILPTFSRLKLRVPPPGDGRRTAYVRFRPDSVESFDPDRSAFISGGHFLKR